MAELSAMPVPAVFPAAAAFPTIDPNAGVSPFSDNNFLTTMPLTVATAARPEGSGLPGLLLPAAMEAAGAGLDPELGSSRAQIEQGLAKLATVNPQLAQTLSEKYANPDTSGGGFMDFVGDLFAPMISIGGKVLDYIVRPAYIIPNIVHDIADGGDLNIGADIGGAFSGNVRHNWNDVFQELGWDGEGFGGFLRATVGFGLDVLTDPVTWLFPLGAGRGLYEAAAKGGAAITGRVAAAQYPELIAKLGTTNAADAAKAFESLVSPLAKAQLNVGGRAATQLGPDAAERLTARMAVGFEGAAKSAVGDLTELWTRLYTMGTSKTLGVALKEGVTLGNGRHFSGDLLNRVYKDVIEAGTGRTWNDPLWYAARSASVLAGGWRLKFAVPFTGFRYISPFTLPFTQKLTFDGLRRFTMGYSGMKRLIANAAGESDPAKAAEAWRAVNVWTAGGRDGGYHAVKQQFPDLIDSIKGRVSNLGSAYWSMSEQVGGLTARFNSAAMASRAGLAGYWTAAEARHQKSAAANFLNNRMNTVTAGDKTYTRGDLKKIAQRRGWVSKNPIVQTFDDEAYWLSEMPRSLDLDGNVRYLSNAELERWWQARPDIAALEDVDDIAAAQARLQRLLDINGSLSDADKGELDLFRALWAGGRDEAAKHDLIINDVTGDFSTSGLLHPARQAQFEAGRDRLGGQRLYIHPANSEETTRLGTHGVTSGSYTDDEFHAIHLTGTPGDDGVEVALKGGNWLRVDRRSGALQSDQSILDEVDEAIDLGASEAMSRSEAAGAVAERQVAMTRATMRTEHVKARTGGSAERPGASGVIVTDEDGAFHLYAFDHNDVKVLDDAAPVTVTPNTGYLPRFLTREVRTLLYGELGLDDAWVRLNAPEMETQFGRSTAHLSLEQADAAVRDSLRKQGHTVPDNMPIFERNPWNVHNMYSNRLAEDIAAQGFNKLTRRLNALNRLSPALLGGPASQPRFEWYLPRAVQKALKKAGKKVEKAAQRHAALTASLDQLEQKAQAESIDRLNTLAAVIELGLSPDEIAQNLISTRLRKTLVTAREAFEAIGQERAAKEQAMRDLQEQRSLYDRVLQWAQESGVFGDDVTPARLDRDTFDDLVMAGAVRADSRTGQFLTDEDLVYRSGKKVVHPAITDARIARTTTYLSELDALNRTLEGSYITKPRDVQAEQAARGGLSEAAEGAAQGDFAAKLLADVPDPTHGRKELWRSQDVVNEPRGNNWNHENASQVEYVRIEDLRAAQEAGTARSTVEFRDEASVAAVMDDFVENGWRSPVEVHRNPDGRVFVGNGNTRLTAAEQLGDEFVPVHTLSFPDLPPRPETVSLAVHMRDYVGRFVGFFTDLSPEQFAKVPSGPPGGSVVSLPVLSPATVAKLSKQTAAAGEAAATLRQRVGTLTKADRKRAAQVGRFRASVHRAAIERNRAVAAMRGVEASPALAFKKVAAGGDMTGWTALRVPGMEGFAMPAYVASEFHWVIERHGINGIREMWRRTFLGPWKRWATYRWPGFHARNFFGAWFNNLLGGVVPHHYTFSFKVGRARNLDRGFVNKAIDPNEFTRYGLGQLGFNQGVTYGELADVLAYDGIGRANTLAISGTHLAANEIEEAALRGDGNPLLKAAQFYERHAKAWGAGVEDFHRVAAWARGMEVTGGDMYGARSFVMMRHGDYSDLTDTEDAVRDLIPFYKWMRTNVPYQIRMLAENPEYLTLPDKLEEAAYDVAGLDSMTERSRLPEWMRETFALPVPDWVPFLGGDTKNGQLAYLMLDMPYEDLYNGLNDYISSGLPLFRNLVESYGIEKSFFSGKPLEGRMVPLSGMWNIPGVRDLLATTGVAERGPDGNLYIDDRLENSLAAWPVYSRFRNFMLSDPDRVQNRVGGVLSMLSGLPVRHHGPDEAASVEAAFYYQELLPVLQAYRDMGVVFPTVDELRDGGMVFTGDATPAAPPETTFATL